MFLMSLTQFFPVITPNIQLFTTCLTSEYLSSIGYTNIDHCYSLSVTGMEPETVKLLNFLMTWLMMMAPMIKWWAKNVLVR